MKVLVAIDDDPLLEHVLATLRWCVRLGDGDQVTVLHATPVFPWMRRAVESNAVWAGWVRAEDEKVERLFSKANRLLSAWGIPVEMLRGEDYAAKEILRVAAERQVDLIVVGALGREERGFLVGSVSQKVKTLAQTDVLIVRPGAPVEGLSFRALLAVDGSPDSLAGVEAFARKTRAGSAEVRLIHVLDLPLTAWDLLASREGEDLTSLPPALREEVDRTFSSALAILGHHGMEATTEVRKGPAAAEILEAATAYRAHLVVMGSRGLSGIRALLLGSVTQRVVRHGKVAVLVARGSGGAERREGRSAQGD